MLAYFKIGTELFITGLLCFALPFGAAHAVQGVHLLWELLGGRNAKALGVSLNICE